MHEILSIGLEFSRQTVRGAFKSVIFQKCIILQKANQLLSFAINLIVGSATPMSGKSTELMMNRGNKSAS